MSNIHNEEIKENILDTICSMSVDEFVYECEINGIKNVDSFIGETLYELVEIKFQDREGY
jgi:hypothetical protein